MNLKTYLIDKFENKELLIAPSYLILDEPDNKDLLFISQTVKNRNATVELSIDKNKALIFESIYEIYFHLINSEDIDVYKVLVVGVNDLDDYLLMRDIIV